MVSEVNCTVPGFLGGLQDLRPLHLTEPSHGRFWTRSGLRGVILRHPSMLHLCGYVRVPKNHRFYGKKNSWNVNYEVHGGVTFLGRFPMVSKGLPSTLQLMKHHWWIGFDCGHLGDLQPGMAALLSQAGAALPGFMDANNSIYREWGYVREQCELLAAQIGKGVPK